MKKHLFSFFFFLLIFTGCSKHVVEQKAVPPPPVVEPEPLPEPPKVIEKKIPGLIPNAVIEQAEMKYGEFAARRFRAYNAKLKALQESPTTTKLETINNFFNQVPYAEDSEVWGKSDYWATPLEFLGKGQGDCEDYVIAKYFALRDLGIGNEQLYFAYVKSITLNRDHMVLSYFETPSSVPLILDSVDYRILPTDQRKDLIPVYNQNEGVLYHAGKSGERQGQVRTNGKFRNRWEQLVRDIARHKL